MSQERNIQKLGHQYLLVNYFLINLNILALRENLTHFEGSWVDNPRKGSDFISCMEIASCSASLVEKTVLSLLVTLLKISCPDVSGRVHALQVKWGLSYVLHGLRAPYPTFWEPKVSLNAGIKH